MSIRRKAIQQHVAKLLRTNKVTSPPVPIEKIAKNLGLDVRLAPDHEGLSGFLITHPDSDTTIIGVNKGHHPNRRRFTIAHEIGHHVLHDNETVHVDKSGSFKIALRSAESSSGLDASEIEANTFAAELLMPEKLLDRDIEECAPSIDLGDDSFIQELAKRYQVSVSAMTFRLANLGYVRI